MVLSPVDFHHRHRTLGFQFLTHPLHRQSGNRGNGIEEVRMGVGHQVAHLPAVRHSRKEYIAPVEAFLPAEFCGELQKKVHVIGLQTFLKRITDVPAGFSPAVHGSLRVAYCKSFPVGNAVHPGSALHRPASVAVKDENQGRIVPERCRQVENIFPVHPPVAETVSYGSGRESCL